MICFLGWKYQSGFWNLVRRTRIQAAGLRHCRPCYTSMGLNVSVSAVGRLNSSFHSSTMFIINVGPRLSCSWLLCVTLLSVTEDFYHSNYGPALIVTPVSILTFQLDYEIHSQPNFNISPSSAIILLLPLLLFSFNVISPSNVTVQTPLPPFTTSASTTSTSSTLKCPRNHSFFNLSLTSSSSLFLYSKLVNCTINSLNRPHAIYTVPSIIRCTSFITPFSSFHVHFTDGYGFGCVFLCLKGYKAECVFATQG